MGGGPDMSLKRVIIVTLVLFLIYFAFTRPDATADGVKAVLAWIPQGAEALATFVTEVLT